MDFDKRLARHDIQGSLAHADMLAAQGIISAQDLSDIQRGMTQIRAEIEAGSFQWLLDLEDVHLNIEKRLVELVGDAGKRLHTGRSRNDQVATDIRLWLREEIDTLIELLRQLRRAPGHGGAGQRRHHHARLHPPAGGPARHLRPPPAGLRRNVRPRRRAPG